MDRKIKPQEDQEIDDDEGSNRGNRLDVHRNIALESGSHGDRLDRGVFDELEAVLDKSDSVANQSQEKADRKLTSCSEVGQQSENRSSEEAERTTCNVQRLVVENEDKNSVVNISTSNGEIGEISYTATNVLSDADDKEVANLNSPHFTDNKEEETSENVRTCLINSQHISSDHKSAFRPSSRGRSSYDSTRNSCEKSKSLNNSEKSQDDAGGVAVENSSQEASFSFRRLSTRHKLTLFCIAFVNFGASAAFALLAPFFPQEAGKKHVDQTFIGMIFGIYEFVIFISAPLLGSVITKIGAKFMFVSGVFVSGICGGLFGTLDMCPSGAIYIVMCFLTRSVEALGSSAVLVASFAIVAHEFPDNVATVFGALETFSGFGMMVGPPLGGALYQLGGFGLPFFTLGGLLIVCGLVCIWLLPIQNHREVPFEGSVLSFFMKPSAFVITMSIVAGSLALGFLDPTLANHFSVFHLTPFWIGLMFFLAPAVYALTAPIWGWIGDNKGYTITMIVVGNFLTAVSFILLGPAPFLSIPLVLWLEVVSLILMGLFLGCALIPTFKALIDSANANGYPDSFATYGIVSGLFNSAFSFGAFLGPMTLGGAVNDKLGFAWTSFVCALCLVFIDFLILLQVYIKHQYHSLKKNKDKGTEDESTPILQTQFSHTDVIGHQIYE